MVTVTSGLISAPQISFADDALEPCPKESTGSILTTWLMTLVDRLFSPR
jgi:hypothetical protein